MKKLFLLLLPAALMFAVAACKPDEPTPPGGNEPSEPETPEQPDEPAKPESASYKLT